MEPISSSFSAELKPLKIYRLRTDIFVTKSVILTKVLIFGIWGLKKLFSNFDHF